MSDTKTSPKATSITGNHVGGSGGGIANAEFVDGFYPPGSRLNATYKRGFAYKTIGYRLPVILTKIIDQLSRDKNAIGEELGAAARDEIKLIVGQLAQLKNELQTNKAIRRLPVVERGPQSTTPDPDSLYSTWNEYLQQVGRELSCPVEEVRWYNAPWLYVECYLYQRIHDAFTCPTSHFQNFDYFRSQKQAGYHESIKEIASLAEFMTKEDLSTSATQQILLHLSLWGNRSDLSLSSGESASHTSVNLMQQLKSLEKDSLLADNSELFWKTLRSARADGDRSLGYVLDNAGFELFTDLCFADCLLNHVHSVTFYVKTVPWFISDTMSHDVVWVLDTMTAGPSVQLQKLSAKWKSHFQDGRFRVVAYPFWTYPHAYSEMAHAHGDPELYGQLRAHTALVFKGDLNYRKLVQDRNWKKSTPFSDALGGFRPAPLLALRTVKADTVAGIEQSKADWLDANKPDWMETGEFGLIQFASAS